MFLGSGIMALADYLDLPELYKSYGDTNWDRLTNYNMGCISTGGRRKAVFNFT